jgi:hypothetical protein
MGESSKQLKVGMSLKDAYAVRKEQATAEFARWKAECPHADVFLHRTELLERPKYFKCHECGAREAAGGSEGTALRQAYIAKRERDAAEAAAKLAKQQAKCVHDPHVVYRDWFFTRIALHYECSKCRLKEPL